MSERVVVQSIDGLYDEEAEAIVRRIDERKFCFKHKFVNASLAWASKTYPNCPYFFIDIENRADQPGFCFPWGVGYGGIRYCKRCKLIDCIHVWDKAKSVVYAIVSSPFYETCSVVETCRACGRRVLTNGWGSCKPSVDSARIITEEYQKLKGVEYDASRFGSGWSLEFPVHISEVLASQGEEAAREEARTAFRIGDISYLMQGRA
jgi:hypothetical protein